MCWHCHAILSLYNANQAKIYIMINRQLLLPQIKSNMVQLLLEVFVRCAPNMADTALKNADASNNARMQETWLSIYTQLNKFNAAVNRQLAQQLDNHIDRALQTAYAKFRPQFSLSAHQGGLSLIGNDELESDLLVGSLADRLRNEAEDALRDLNIRIAILFDTEEVKERENPFRPYVIAKSITDASESLALKSYVTPHFSRLLGECLAVSIEQIYVEVNRQLSGQGVAAELNLTVRKAQEKAINPVVALQAAASSRAEQGVAPASHDGGHRPAPSSTDPQVRFTGQSAFGQSAQPAVESARYQPAAQTGNSAAIQAEDDYYYAQHNLDRLLHSIRQYSNAREEPSSAIPSMAEAMREDGATPLQASKSVSSQSPLPHHRSNPTTWLSGVQQIGAGLRRLLGVGNTPYRGYASGDTDIAPARTVSTGLKQSIDALHQANQAADEWVDGNGAPRNLILMHRAQLSEQAHQQDEQMTLDVVAMLFEFILSDQSVPAMVRVELARLQFVILKIAVRDPNLLTQRAHPVRLLVNRIATIATAHSQIDTDHELMTQKIRQIVDALVQETEDEPAIFISLFTRLLDEFDVFIAAELRSKNEKMQRVVTAFEQVPMRTQRYHLVSMQLREVLTGQDVDLRLYDFLMSAWVQVIEYASELDATIASRFRKFVPDLLWSLRPKHTEKDRQLLTNTLSGLITTLREGMALIAWPQDLQKELMDWLFVIHTRAMFAPIKTGGMNAALEKVPSAGHFSQFLNDTAVKADEMTAQEQQVVSQILYDTTTRKLSDQVSVLDDHFAEQLLPDPDAISLMEMGDVSLEQDLNARLHQGVMVELKLDRHPVQMRLSWINRKDGHLLLSMDEQHTPILMSLRAFKRLLTRSRVRFVEHQPLFERALQSLLDSAGNLMRDETDAGSSATSS